MALFFCFLFYDVSVYGDYDVSSNYRKTEFNSTKWIQTYHNCTLNTMLGLFSVEYIPTLYENFTMWTEVDVPNRLSQTSTVSTFTGLLRSDNVYLYKAWNIKDWAVSFNFYIDSVTLTDTQVYRCDLIAFTSALGSRAQLRPLNEETIGLFIQADTGSNDYDIAIHEETNAFNWISGFVEIDLDTKYYVSMSKTGTTFNCKVYTDSAKTNKIFDETLTLHSDWTLAYINCPNSLGFPGDHQTSGYIEYLYLDSAIGGYLNNGIIYTKDLLANTTEKSVMVGINSTAVSDTRVQLYGSPDNSTWELLIDNNGLGELRQYREVLYNYSSLYVRLNLTTIDPSVTPFVDELFYLHTYECVADSGTKPYVFIILFTIIGMLLGYAIDRT